LLPAGVRILQIQQLRRSTVPAVRTTPNGVRQSNREESSADGRRNTPTLQGERLVSDMMTMVTEYARQNPGNAALWCLGVGFVLGWKLKPW
jgi:hypothetical protein